MEFMEGETLANRVEKRSPEQAPVGGAQLLEATINVLALPKQGAGVIKRLRLPHAVRQMVRPDRMISAEVVRNCIFPGEAIKAAKDWDTDWKTRRPL